MFNQLKNTLVRANQVIGGSLKRGANGIGRTISDNLDNAMKAIDSKVGGARRGVSYTRAAQNAPRLQRPTRSGLPEYSFVDVAKSISSRGNGRGASYTRAPQNAPHLEKAVNSGMPKYSSADIANSLSTRGRGVGAEYKRAVPSSRISEADLPQYNHADIARSLASRGAGIGAEYRRNDSDVPFI